MDNLFINAGIIAFIYILVKFAEMRVILKENKPLKVLLREAVMVYLSVLGGDFILQQVAPLKSAISAPTVFTSPPDF